MKQLLTSLALTAISCSSFAGVIVVEGKYQDKNLYVQNGYAGNGVGFCTYEVAINGKTTTDEVNSSAFEIDFSAYQIQPGTPVVVEIRHKDDCNPKVLNPEALEPKATFEVTSISIDPKGLLTWSTKNEMGSLPYVVEQFRWNKWVKIGEVEGNGTPDENNYSFKIVPHSGKNQYRVKQVDYTGQPKLSKTIDYMSTTPEISFSPAKVSKEITFTAGTTPTETMFEIYDQFGNIVKRGFASVVDASNLPKGAYYLNYDNKMGEFIKK